MRRALFLIITLTTICLGSGLWLDARQTAVAQECIRLLEGIRQQALAGQFAGALEDERFFHARWQQESQWLKCLISHEYIHAVDEPLLRLGTALEQGWLEEALLASDEVFGALKDLEEGHRATLVNVV